MNLKLYRVTLVGLSSYLGRQTDYKTSYVVAEHPTEAYEIVKHYLDEMEHGHEYERRLEKIEVIADSEVKISRTKLYSCDTQGDDDD